MWPKVSISFKLIKKHFLFLQENFHAIKSYRKIYPHKYTIGMYMYLLGAQWLTGSRIIVVHVHANGFLKVHPACHNIANVIKSDSNSQMTDKHDADCSKLFLGRKVIYTIGMYMYLLGAQWLSGRVLDSRPRGRGFKPHRRHCVVSLRKTHLFMLSTGSTQADPSKHN